MKKNNKMIIVFLFIVLFIILGFILFNNRSKNNTNVKDNQIVFKNISKEEVAEIYFSDFMDTIEIDVLEAYKLIDSSKMSYEEFLNFVDELYVVTSDEGEDNYKISSYKIKDEENYKLFYIKDINDRTYIFKENSIMNYTVYLNENDVR